MATSGYVRLGGVGKAGSYYGSGFLAKQEARVKNNFARGEWPTPAGPPIDRRDFAVDLERAIDLRRCVTALSAIDPRRARFIRLRLRGRTLREIAARAGLSVEAVRVIIRGRSGSRVARAGTTILHRCLPNPKLLSADSCKLARPTTARKGKSNV